MQVSITENKHCSYIVTGSDGLIGSEITSAIKLSERTQITDIKNFIAPKTKEKYKATLGEAINFLSSKSKSKKLILVLAHGHGGFQLDEKEATIQMHEFNEFMHNLSNLKEDRRLDVLNISSLGVHLSRVGSYYKDLIFYKEELISNYIGGINIRLPSMWGFKGTNKIPRGLIAQMLWCTFHRQPAIIYGNLNTARRYIHISQIGDILIKQLQILRQSKRQDINIESSEIQDMSTIISTIRKVSKRGLSLSIVKSKEIFYENHTSRLPEGKVARVLVSVNEQIRSEWNKLILQQLL